MAEGERRAKGALADPRTRIVLLALTLVVLLVFVAGAKYYVAVNRALAWAVHLSSIGGTKAALNLGADPSRPGVNGATPLHQAVWRGNETIVELLLQHGADPDGVGGSGGTPLCRAAVERKSGIVELLLRHHANPNTPIAKGKLAGYTPLILAAASRDVESVRALIAAGATVDAFDPQRGTALSMAAFVRDLQVMRILLDAGADPDGGENNVFTPLYWAVSLGHRDVAELLLAHGATPWPQDKRARRLLDRALARHPELRPVLEKYAHRHER